MKKKHIRLSSLLVSLVVSTSFLFGCGAFGWRVTSPEISSVTSGQVEPTAVYMQAASPLDQICVLSEENDNVGASQDVFFHTAAAIGDLYAVVYTDSREKLVRMCILDKDGEDAQDVVLASLPETEDAPGIACASVAPDGRVAAVRKISEKDGHFSWVLQCFAPPSGFDLADEEGWSAKLDEISEGEGFDPPSLASTDKATLLYTEKSLRIYNNKNGSLQGEIALPSGNIHGIVCSNEEGDLFLADRGDASGKIYKVDTMAEKLTETGIVLTGVPGLYTFSSGSGGYDLFAVGQEGIYGCSQDGSEPKQVLNFSDSDLGLHQIECCAAFLPDSLVMAWSETHKGDAAALFKKADAAAFAEKTFLTLGCIQADDDLRMAVTDFNKSNGYYRIILREYPCDEEGNSRLNAEIAAGNVPDILCVSPSMPVDSYAEKGLFEDIESRFKEDPEVGRGQYLTNILDASRIGGKMYFVVPAFTLSCLEGRKADFGDRRGISVPQLEKMIQDRQLEYGTVLGLQTRSSVLDWSLVYGMNEYVDWAQGTCSFDTDAFIHLLEFVKRFPKDIDDKVDREEFEDNMRSGDQLLMFSFLFNIDSYMKDRYGYIGQEVAYLGYPGTVENGPAIENQLTMAMSSTAADKEGCWQFLRTFYLEDYQNSREDSGAFPVSRNALEMQADRAMHPHVAIYTDEHGKKHEVTDHGEVRINGTDIEIPAPTQADIDEIMKLLESADTRSQVDSNIYVIVSEEAGAFFDGQKTAEETADVIQKRVRIYLSESR